MIQRLFVFLSVFNTGSSYFAFTALLMVGLTACGGGSDLQQGTLEAPVLRLESLVIEGGELAPDFVSTRTGVYEIEVDDDISSLNVLATLSADTPVDSRASILDSAIDPNSRFCFEFAGDIDIVSGTAFDLPIEEGDSKYILRIANADYTQCVDYLFNVYRTGSTATLASISFSPTAVVEFVGYPEAVDPSDEAPEPVTVFDPEVFSYDVSVPYSSCALAVIPRASDSRASLTLDGIGIGNLSSRFVPLEPGIETVVPIEVTSADGLTSQTYEFNVTRAASVDTDFETDASLKSVSLSDNGQLIDSFHCFDEIVSAQVNSDVETVDLALTTSGPNSTMTYSLLEDGVFTDPIAVPEGGVVADIALASGNNFLTIVVTADSDAEIPTTATYLFEIFRTTTDWVYVDTATDLQQALLNALPNQEIVIRRGVYTGAASVAESGSDDAHFFSDVSGTLEQPIILRGLNSGAVTLKGDDLSSGSVLTLAGDYWQIVNLQLQNAQKGLVLNGASNNIFDSFIISNVGERGIHVKNASSNNIFSKFGIANTGAALTDGESEVRAEALVVGSDDSDWLTASPAGEYDPTDLNNRFFNMVFGSGVVSELVDIKEGSVGTEIAYSRFFADDIREAEEASTIVIKGNDVKLHHNNFSIRNATVIDSVIATRDASESFVTEAWGENAEVFSNIFSMSSNETSVLVDAGESDEVFVADNQRTDAMTANYTGDGIDITFNVPSYRIQTVEDETLCLSPGTIVVADGVDEISGDRMILGSCADQLSEWLLQHEEDNALVFENVVSGEKIVVSLSVVVDEFGNQSITTLSESFLPSYADTGGIEDQTALLRWTPSFFADRVILTSKSNTSRSMTATTLGELAAAGDFADPDFNVVVVTEADGMSAQRFRFVEVE